MEQPRGVAGLGAAGIDYFYKGEAEDGKREVPRNTPLPEGEPVMLEPGGPAFWAVATIRALSGGTIEPKFVGVVGGRQNDPLHKEVERAGLPANYLVTVPEEDSARSIVTIDTRDPKKRHIDYSSAPAKLRPEQAEALRTFDTEKPVILHLDSREELAAPDAARIVREQNPECLIYLDTGLFKGHTVELIHKAKPNVIQMPKSAALALLHADESLSLEELARAALDPLSKEGYAPDCVIVTDGEHGSSYASPREGAIQTGTVPAYHVDTVDTNGMGDVFAGGFSYARQLLGYDWKEALRFGGATAALKSLKLGRVGNIPSAGEVIAFMQERADK